MHNGGPHNRNGFGNGRINGNGRSNQGGHTHQARHAHPINESWHNHAVLGHSHTVGDQTTSTAYPYTATTGSPAEYSGQAGTLRMVSTGSGHWEEQWQDGLNVGPGRHRHTGQIGGGRTMGSRNNRR